MSLLMFTQERCSALEFALNLIQCGLNANFALKFAFKGPLGSCGRVYYIPPSPLAGEGGGEE